MTTNNPLPANHSLIPPSSAVRMVVALVAIIGCLFVVLSSAKAGYSRLLTRYATVTASLDGASEAVRLAPSDPEAHRARGSVLRYLGRLAEATQEYETAVRLRPRDDLIWLELGTVRDELDDGQGALAALDESVRAAPFYAHPRWQRGNLLLRQARYDEAFADLRQAAASNPELQPSLVDLAWGISKFDPKLMVRILQINDDQMRLSFARFLARKGRGQEAIEQLRAAGSVSDQIRKEMVLNLIGNKAFREAFEIWRSDSTEERIQQKIFDGGFEGPVSFEEVGFGWRVANAIDGISLSVDATEKQNGAKSLRIQFNGKSNPGIPLVSQWVLVDAAKRYRVSFAARTQDVVSGGLPLVTVSDAANDLLIGKSEEFREGTNSWQVQSFEFKTGPESKAISVNLRRENCSSDPCPIFGFVWLDSFSIEELK